jgi:hypothetical protein
VRIDPETGALLLSLACPCHILPFEYRPGTIVLDIRNGPAPEGSAFEVAFAAAAAPVPGTPPVAEAPVVYDWRAGLPRAAAADAALPLATGGASLLPLRDALLAELSRGAANGLVDMQLPPPVRGEDVAAMDDLAWVRIGLGPLPGVELGLGENLAPAADACVPDSDLALSDWGGDRTAAESLAEARSGLYGEFDRLEPEAVVHAVKLHLFLGFGAEARQYADLLPEADRPAVLLSMARLVDGEADPGTPFAAMLGCDGAAALWAALAHSSLPAATPVNTDAIVRSFAALPSHLRRHLGPRLADLLLPRDAAAARMIRDAMARTPDIAPGVVALADAQAALQADQPELALDHAETALAEGASGAGGLIALVEAHAKALKPLPPDQAEAVLAMLQDAGTGPDAARLLRAAILSLALSGQTDEAFALAGPESPYLADLWAVAAVLADDSAFLTHALATPGAPVPQDLAEGIARRLQQLGFPDAALAWLGAVSLADPPERRMLAAAAELDRGDARRALTLLAGLQEAEALDLRRQVETSLGAFEAAQRSAETAGLAEEAARLAGWRADWSGLAALDLSPWSEAAAYAAPSTPAGEGPLARGAALLEASAGARAAVEALLAAVEPPNP